LAHKINFRLFGLSIPKLLTEQYTNEANEKGVLYFKQEKENANKGKTIHISKSDANRALYRGQE